MLVRKWRTGSAVNPIAMGLRRGEKHRRVNRGQEGQIEKSKETYQKGQENDEEGEERDKEIEEKGKSVQHQSR